MVAVLEYVYALECLCFLSKACQKLVNYGSIQVRIAVQATEDVYEQYKRKARQVEEEWKQSSL